MVRLLNTFNHKYFYPQYAQNIQRSRKNKDKQTKKGTSLVVEIFKKNANIWVFYPKTTCDQDTTFWEVGPVHVGSSQYKKMAKWTLREPVKNVLADFVR